MNKVNTIGFNPTLVRLRLYTVARIISALLCFNPTLVRLRREVQGPHVHEMLLVSIPRWFD